MLVEPLRELVVMSGREFDVIVSMAAITTVTMSVSVMFVGAVVGSEVDVAGARVIVLVGQ